MKAFILAAGLGTRLQPITKDIPKPLIPVMGIPIICYSLMLLKEAKINSVVCNLHYKHQEIIDFFNANNNFGFDIKFSIEEVILGTGGGLKNCEKYLNDDNFIIINSDVITDLYLPELIHKFENSYCEVMPVLKKNNSNTTVAVENDLIVDFKNHLKTNKKNNYDYTGMTVASPEIFKYLQKEFSSVVYTAFTELAKMELVGYYLNEDMWQDIGSINNYKQVNEDLKNSNSSLVERIHCELGLKNNYQSYLNILEKYNI